MGSLAVFAERLSVIGHDDDGRLCEEVARFEPLE